MDILFLIKYNNSFNRIIKREETGHAYIEKASNSYYFSVQFNPNDGIETKQIVNWPYSDLPDYAVTLDTNTDEIFSRWYVTEAVRTRAGQYEFSLKRDVIADHKSEILNSKAFIEKAIIRDENNPLLLNNEGVSFNQVKVREYPLYDKTRVPWLVMYIKKETLGTNVPITIDHDSSDEVFETLSTPITQWQYYNYQTTQFKVAFKTYLRFRYYQSGGINQLSVWINSEGQTDQAREPSDTNLRYNTGNLLVNLRNYFTTEVLNDAINNANSAYGMKDNSELQALLAYNGKTIKDSLGNYYDITVTNSGSQNESFLVRSNESATASLHAGMNTAWNTINSSQQVANNNAFKVNFNEQIYTVKIVESTKILSATCNLNNFAKFTNSPLYDIICLPYGNIKMRMGPIPATIVQTSKEQSLAIMNAIARTLTSEKVIDLQLVPYCPVQQYITDESTFGAVITGGFQNSDFMSVTYNGTKLSYVILAPEPTFTFDIRLRLMNKQVYDGDNSAAMNVKYANDCAMFRLCSPNYNGLFEFNLAKNGGSVEYFNVDCTYKPITPYIHVNPNFKNLYGRDFDDARGLICGGDYSLGIVNDAWNAYEIQNKNYQNIFDRQIQNVDFNNSIARKEAGWQMAAGVGQGAASGAVGGAMVGGAYGAIAGAVVGAGTSLAGGVADLANLGARQRESVNMSIDMYNMQLGNVKALPIGITRTSAITANNKLVPFLEVYECTEVERNAFFEKLIFDGMTIGVIDTINNYVTTEYGFIKCRLIRNETIADDTHLFNTIYEELAKGVYL